MSSNHFTYHTLSVVGGSHMTRHEATQLIPFHWDEYMPKESYGAHIQDDELHVSQSLGMDTSQRVGVGSISTKGVTVHKESPRKIVDAMLTLYDECRSDPDFRESYRGGIHRCTRNAQQPGGG